MSSGARGVALLGGSFLLTSGLLFAAYSATRAAPPASMSDASPTPTARPTARASEKLDQESAEPDATSSAAYATLLPTLTPNAINLPPAGLPGQTARVRVEGGDYADSQLPVGSMVLLDDSVALLDTGTATKKTMSVTWTLPPDWLPDTQIAHVEARVCGNASGDSWNLSGPSGSQPAAYLTELTAADGCWTFAGGNGSSVSVVATLTGKTTMRVDYVEFSVTFGLPAQSAASPADSPVPSPSG